MSLSIRAGELQEVRQVASPNADERPDPRDISLLVIHNISLPPGEFGGDHVVQLFTNTLSETEHPYFAEIVPLRVSAHLFIDRAGSVTQFVNLNRRAWHAGESSWCERQCCNDYSVGIELEGTDYQGFTDEQYDSLIAVTGSIQQCFPAITMERIVGHSDIAPGRKTDPGLCFDWHHYLSSLSR
jgi:N-acetyl-anhydromuramoyl-L-alanine amidase